MEICEFIGQEFRMSLNKMSSLLKKKTNMKEIYH